MSNNRKVILYISMSLDGYIASPEGNLDFLSLVTEEGEDYGYSDFTKTIDTIIIGRKTYDKVISMGYDYSDTDNDIFIITRTERPSDRTSQFYTGSLSDLITALKMKEGKNIYCDGGAEIVNELLKNKLIDEFIISVIPIFLGDGIRLFKNGQPGQELKLVSSKQFKKGLVQLHYEITG